ncbi:MAG: TolC family protein [Saprospiraceae bacterium]|nr:TolC family protein [Saprospiraceae bacterium]MDW8228962.1 TolC family protein [Saprospiraceae bacterium]
MKNLWLFSLILAISGTKAHADDADTLSLPLREAIHRALTSSIQTRKARWERHAAALQIAEQRRGALTPKVEALANADYVPALPTTFLPATLFGGQEGAYVSSTLGQPWQLFASVRVEQPLFDEAARRLAPASALSQSLQDALVELSEEEIIFQTTQLFYQVLQARASLRALDAHLEQFEALERMVRLRVENDQAVQTDVQRIQVTIAHLQARRHELEGGIEALRQGLQFLCGIPLEQPVALADLSNPSDSIGQSVSAPLAIERTTTHRLLEGRLSLLRIQEHSMRARGWPKLGLYAQAGVLSQRADVRFAASNGRWYPLGLVGLRLEWPLLEGYRRRPGAERLRLEIQRNEEERNDYARARQMELLQASTQRNNALHALRARKQAVALAREVVSQLQLAYRNGVTPLSDLLAAQTALAEAETQYEQQVFTCRLAEVKWLRAAGLLRTLLE